MRKALFAAAMTCLAAVAAAQTKPKKPVIPDPKAPTECWEKTEAESEKTIGSANAKPTNAPDAVSSASTQAPDTTAHKAKKPKKTKKKSQKKNSPSSGESRDK